MLTTREKLEAARHLAAQRVARQIKIGAFAARQEIFRREMSDLIDRLLDRRLTPLEFNLDARDLVKDLHISAYAIGRSGQWSDITPGNWGRHVSSVLREQYAFLRAWSTELYDLSGVSEAQLKARAGLYAAAARQSMERGLVAEIGVEAATLPAYPADGSTECRANCKCRWAIRILSKARGDYDASWRLGAAEHCRTCRARARAWRRLKIRGGRFTEEPEPIEAG